MPQRVTVRVKGDEATVETEGFAGEECLRATERLGVRLGGKEIAYEAKPEMYEKPVEDKELV